MKKIYITTVVCVLFVLLFCSVAKDAGCAVPGELTGFIKSIKSSYGYYANEEEMRVVIYYSNAKLYEKYCAARISTNAFFDKDEAQSDRHHFNVKLNFDKRIPESILCSPLSKKYAVSSNGEVWTYASNYAILYAEGEPDLIIRSVSGMKKTDASELGNDMDLNRDISFEKGCTTTEQDICGTFKKICCHGKDRGISFIVANGYSSPVLYDLSEYKN